ncbi:YEATS domain-containing protein 2 [Podila epigama]|nr:YEATS domain-containing protein 2 [Podila epigama]
MSEHANISFDGNSPDSSRLNVISQDEIMTQAQQPLSASLSLMEDEATRQKVTDVINHQFDLEILLRHAEGAVIAKELAKAERMLEDLRHAILSERQGSPYGNSTVSRSLASSQNNTYHSGSRFGTRPSNARRTVSSYRMPEAIYAVRADGQFVRMGCPKCDRYDFGSTQGLTNHMRLSHRMVFKSTEEGVRFCGTVVPSSEVPLDHPCRTKLVFSSVGAIDANQDDTKKPSIKTYDEDVDLESEEGSSRTNDRESSAAPQQRRKNSGTSTSSSPGSDSESNSSDAGSGNNGRGAGKRRRSSLAPSMARPQKGRPGKESDDSDEDEDSASETPQRRSAGKGPMRKYGSVSQGHYNPQQPSRIPSLDTSRTTPHSLATEPITPGSRMSSAASSRANSPSIHPLMSEHEISEPSTPVSGVPARSLPAVTTPSIQPPHHSAQPTSTSTVVTGPGRNGHPGQLQPTIISFGASAIQAGLPAPLDTVGSRFYIKRRIVVGNVSKFLPMEKRDPRLKDFPYKWMIYVDGTPKPEDITAYVSKVEFHLHESYKPNHIITVTEPPFHLSRFAWGETQIKVRLFFYDPRNKPVEIYHRLALDPTHCGRQVHGRERNVDLELDRHTLFQDIIPFKPRTKGSNNKLNGQSAMIINSAVDSAMADIGEDDELELQNTLSKPNRAQSHLGANGSSTSTGALAPQGSGRVDTVRAASIDEGILSRQKAKETSSLYCKACGALWKEHRTWALGMAGGLSTEPVLLNEENGEGIPNCPHHPKFYAAKDMGEDERVLRSLLVGRTKNQFALDMLKKCGIVDKNGRPLSAHDRLLFEQEQQQQQQQQQLQSQQQDQDASAMDLDIGDSENSPVVDTIAHVRKLTDAFQRLEVYRGRRSEIDWVLSVMDELKLKTLSLDHGPGGIGGGLSATSTSQKQDELDNLLRTPGLVKVPESISQRAVVGGLLVQATKAFLGRVLSKAIEVHRAEAEAEKGPESIMMELDSLHAPEQDISTAASTTSTAVTTKATLGTTTNTATKVSTKLLAPHHIYRALQANPEELDFLTNDYENMEGIGETMAGVL